MVHTRGKRGVPTGSQVQPRQKPRPGYEHLPQTATHTNPANGPAPQGRHRRQTRWKVEVTRPGVDAALLVGEVEGAVERLGVGVVREQSLSAAARLLATSVLDVNHAVHLVPAAKASFFSLRAKMWMLFLTQRPLQRKEQRGDKN